MSRDLVYRLGSAWPVAAALRRLHAALLPEVVSAVAYHGLVDTRLAVPDPCFMPVARFARQMEYLARNFTVLHVEEAFAPDRPRAERPVACVTFDDGLGSVHDLALPVLERLGIPATVYLVTDLVDTGGEVWWTRLHRSVCQTSTSEVRVGDRRFGLAGPRERELASAGLQREIKALARPRFAGVLEDVLGQLGVPGRGAAAPWAAGRTLRTEEIRRMARGGLVRFGAHTASHQILTRTDPDDARREIERSVAAVASLVGRPSRTFAYPNGGPDDFDDVTIAALRGAGLEYAVTTIEGPNPRGADPYRLRRSCISATDHPSRFSFQVHHARAVAEAARARLSFPRGAAAGGVG